MRHEEQLHVVLDLLGDVHQVLAVALGEQHALDPRSVGGEDLLLDPAHGHHHPTQRDLAGHRDVLHHASIRQQRDQRRGQGDPCGGPVLADGAGRHVDVQVALGEEVVLQPQDRRVGAGEGQRGLGRLLHHLTQVPGQDQLALALHPRGLDEEDRPAERRPGQPGGHAGDVRAFRHLGPVLHRAEDVEQALLADQVGYGLIAGHCHRDAAAGGGELPLQVSDPGLAGVGVGDLEDRLVVDGELLRHEAVLLDLLGDQVPLGDVKLLVAGVTRQLQDLEPVLERRRDRLDLVGCGEEEHLRQIEGHLQEVVGEPVVLLGI